MRSDRCTNSCSLRAASADLSVQLMLIMETVLVRKPGCSFHDWFFGFRAPSVPLPQRELSARLAGLILNKVRHQVMAHPNVGASVAAHLVVVGG